MSWIRSTWYLGRRMCYYAVKNLRILFYSWFFFFLFFFFAENTSEFDETKFLLFFFSFFVHTYIAVKSARDFNWKCPWISTKIYRNRFPRSYETSKFWRDIRTYLNAVSDPIRLLLTNRSKKKSLRQCLFTDNVSIEKNVWCGYSPYMITVYFYILDFSILFQYLQKKISRSLTDDNHVS